jgi:hypothetical protein
MKKITLLLCFILAIFYSCRMNSSNSANSKAGEFESADKVVIGFLEWYRDNFDKMHPFYLMSEKDDSTHMISGRWGDSTVFYSINNKGTEKFLKVLNSSGFLSKKYINNKRKSFKKRGGELIEAKQSDGPPLGFSAEEVLYLNDIEETFPLVKKAKVTQIELNDKSAIYKVDIFENIQFKLSNYDGKWLIDEIEL